MLGSRILLILVRAGLLIGLVTALWATVTGIWWLINPSAFAPEGATIIGSPGAEAVMAVVVSAGLAALLTWLLKASFRLKPTR